VSNEAPAYEGYWTPNTHRVVATTVCVPRDAQEGTWEGVFDVSIPSRAGIAMLVRGRRNTSWPSANIGAVTFVSAPTTLLGAALI
jgi:hypothetical protein